MSVNVLTLKHLFKSLYSLSFSAKYYLYENESLRLSGVEFLESNYLQQPDFPHRNLLDGLVLVRFQELLDGHDLAVFSIPAFDDDAVAALANDSFVVVLVHFSYFKKLFLYFDTFNVQAVIVRVDNFLQF